MDKLQIRNDENGRPCHAFPRNGGQSFNLCARNAALCVLCKEHGVPIIPADPYQLMVDAITDHWDKPWRERFFSVPEKVEKGVHRPKRGAHVIALDGQGLDLKSIDLGFFGTDDSIMPALGALVQVHNDMVARQLRAPACTICHGTGYVDFAHQGLEPCKHEEAGR